MRLNSDHYDMVLIETEDEYKELEELVFVTKECAIDTETTGLHWALGDTAFMASMCPSSSIGFATFQPHFVRRLLEAMDREDALFIFHNAVFDLHMLRNWTGWAPEGGYSSIQLDDTMWGFRNLYPGKPANLKIASKLYAPPGFDVDGPQKLVKDWLVAHSKPQMIAGKSVVKEPTWDNVPGDIMLPYAIQDAWLTLISNDGLQKDIDDAQVPERFSGSKRHVPTLREVYDRDVAICAVVTNMERAGFPVDGPAMLDGAMRGDIAVNDAFVKWEELGYGDINPGSPVQLKKLIYGTLGEPVQHLTKANQPSTAEIALRDIRDKELSGLLLGMRGWQKHNQRVRELQSFTAPDGRVHSSFKADGARTGRFSSSDPALQNITRPNPKIPYTMVRDYFRPTAGKEFLFMDFSQIELRLAAEYMHDPDLIQAFKDGKDFHRLTAARTYGIEPDAVTKEQRALSKILNFSILYGAGKRRVTESLRYGAAGTEPLTIDEARSALALLGAPTDGAGTILVARDGSFIQDPLVEDVESDQPLNNRVEDDVDSAALFTQLGTALLSAYHRENPMVRTFTNRAGQSAVKYGHIVTAFGNTINIPPEKGHIAGNAIIQGSAAGLMKETLIRTEDVCYNFCQDYNLAMWDDVRMITTIHDEVGIELPIGGSKDLAMLMHPVMTNWPQFEVPIEVEFSVVPNGSSWAFKEDLKL